MIQRIQSVWLLIASIVSFLTLKLSFYSGTYLTDNLYHQLNGTENLTLLIPTIALGIIALVTIFLYKNRIVQLRLCLAAILVDVLLIVMYFRSLKDFSKGDFAITAVLHLVIIAALILASSGINKDEKLIKDSNRLR